MNNGIYIGEASISLANACFPDLGVSGNKGYDGHDVLYLGFTGNNAAAGPGADWKARSFGEFEDSLAKVGDGLVAGVVVGENQNSDVDSAVLSRPRSWDAVCAWVLLVVLAIYK